MNCCDRTCVLCCVVFICHLCCYICIAAMSVHSLIRGLSLQDLSIDQVCRISCARIQNPQMHTCQQKPKPSHPHKRRVESIVIHPYVFISSQSSEPQWNFALTAPYLTPSTFNSNTSPALSIFISSVKSRLSNSTPFVVVNLVNKLFGTVFRSVVSVQTLMSPLR